MKIISLDVGIKKTGIAISDELKIISQPLTTIYYEAKDFNYLIDEVLKILSSENIDTILIGITYNIDKTLSDTGKIIYKFYEKLLKVTNIKIILVDERGTSKASDELMRSMKFNKKKKKESRDVFAAQIILKNYLDEI